MTMIGFDYASIDGNYPPDFEKAAAAGARFGIIRAIYGRSTTMGGAPWRDPVWARDHGRVRAAGLTLGGYLFLCVVKKSARGTASPEAQAQAMIDYAGDLKPGDFPPFVDVEEKSDLLSGPQYYDWVLRACKTLRDHYGTWPGIYTSARVWSEYLKGHPAGELIACPLWIAKPWPWAVRTPVHLDGAPSYDPYAITPWGSQYFHYQYQGDGLKWPGFNATVDVDRFNVLAKGAKNDSVAWMQQKLNTFADSQTPPLKVDGDFGQLTKDALKAFQAAHALEVDGVYGPRTHAFLAWF